MQVTVDKNSGFCWGVVRAVNMAEAELSGQAGNGHAPRLYSLGDIIHNPVEVDRLRSEGLETIGHGDFERIAEENRTLGIQSKILIRAHGEPPSTYTKLQELGLEVVNATCPVVGKVQERIRKFYDKNYQIVIFGKKEHAEVIGLRGVVNDEAIVVKSVEEALAKIKFDRPTVLFSQTTMDRPTFREIRDRLKERISDLVVDTMEETAVEFQAKDTICGQVSGRETKLAELARQQDLVIFVAGHNSSNGKVLFNVAKDANPNTYFIEDERELLPEWFEKVNNVAVTGATSTPQWLMQRVGDAIYKLCGEPEKAQLLPVLQ
ncbi:MAG: 4-hydroxy-3-methylbut-2-enyl diphosphate reductase [Bacteroidota bacterium]|nr:4-hydroxy-3-methylbut-2-enyl diphosphate reductase [Bacteroidota bacterium]MDP4234689.1 4-hydroxy-3-methylbut-2-enyl diphosphate reductase [Bacteroidota bacterium]MDP4243912.1 4-hydroxy-3-methylbut-2-enyl diphosphate reductase [Bacteroidota bacterium]MDP4288865.1 4-hydroxy-3-methylbut-2-enyl diphosphate reductase [Bacteroidota bacterium]